jgi:hypothetical protein
VTEVSLLDEWLAGNGRRMKWIDFERYACRVFAGSPTDWVQVPGRRVRTLADVQRLAASDVILIDLGPLIFDAIARTVGEPGDRISTAIHGPDVGRLVVETADAAAHQFSGSVELVLSCPSPVDLLVAAGAQREVIDLNDADDAGLHLIDLIRLVSDRPFSGLLLRSEVVFEREDLEAWTPILSAASHYGWVRIARLDFPVELGSDRDSLLNSVDVLLTADLTHDSVEQDRRLGGGLGQSFWMDPDIAAPVTGICFGEVPPNASPESVMSRLVDIGPSLIGSTSERLQLIDSQELGRGNTQLASPF